MDNETLELFLKELSELTNKYEIKIGGCGCCGSPFLYTGEFDYFANKLNYENGEYSIDKF